jgi:hypothetical protein
MKECGISSIYILIIVKALLIIMGELSKNKVCKHAQNRKRLIISILMAEKKTTNFSKPKDFENY